MCANTKEDDLTSESGVIDTDRMIEVLEGMPVDLIENDCVPDYLASKYNREGAALNLGMAGNSNPKIIGALFKSAITDEEEDVRLASFEALYKLEKRTGVALAYSLLNDEYERIREEASVVLNQWSQVE